MPTRIYHRIDALTDWEAANQNSLGKLAQGEIGVATTPAPNGSTAVIARMGVNATATPWADCPVVFAGTDQNLELNGSETRPVSYDNTGEPLSDGAVIAWDGSKWAATEEVLRLDAMPTANGTVVWNSSLGKFQVGSVLPANDIDGGSY